MRGYRITIDQRHTGEQLRDYGPHVDEGYITVELLGRPGQDKDSVEPWPGMNDRQLRHIVQTFAPFSEEPKWPDAELSFIEQHGHPDRAVWHYRVQSPFID